MMCSRRDLYFIIYSPSNIIALIKISKKKIPFVFRNAICCASLEALKADRLIGRTSIYLSNNVRRSGMAGER